MGDAALLPLQLMDVLQPWAGLLAAEPAVHLQAFLAAAEAEGRGEPSLEEIGAEVVRLRGEAEAVTELCGDDVRTGGSSARQLAYVHLIASAAGCCKWHACWQPRSWAMWPVLTAATATGPGAGLYLVRCRPIKEALAAAAQQLARGLLEHVRLVLRQSSAEIGEGCAALAAEVRPARPEGKLPIEVWLLVQHQSSQ
jgi:hypothetical protein